MKTNRSKTPNLVPDQVLPFPLIADEASLSTLRASTSVVARAWAWIQKRQTVTSDSKRLRVAETVSLGEKRFVAVVHVDGRHFLLAGSPTNIVLLAQLDPKEPFEKVLKETMAPPKRRPAKLDRKRIARATVPKPTQPQATENFADVIDQGMADSAMQAAKQTRKSNDKTSSRQTGNA